MHAKMIGQPKIIYRSFEVIYLLGGCAMKLILKLGVAILLLSSCLSTASAYSGHATITQVTLPTRPYSIGDAVRIPIVVSVIRDPSGGNNFLIQTTFRGAGVTYTQDRDYLPVSFDQGTATKTIVTQWTVPRLTPRGQYRVIVQVFRNDMTLMDQREYSNAITIR